MAMRLGHCWLTLLGFSLSSPASAQNSVLDRRCASGPTFVACLRQTEAEVFQKHPALAHRRGDDLVLMLRTGDSVIIRDTVITTHGIALINQSGKIVMTPDTTAVDGYHATYWLADFEEHFGYFVLAMRASENRGSLVISRNSGWRRFIDFAMPAFNQSGQFVAATIPTGAAFWEPRIDVFRVTTDSLISELHLAEQELFVSADTLWGPINPRWKGDTLTFETDETFVANQRRYWQGKTMALVRRNGQWQFLPRK